MLAFFAPFGAFSHFVVMPQQIYQKKISSITYECKKSGIKAHKFSHDSWRNTVHKKIGSDCGGGGPLRGKVKHYFRVKGGGLRTSTKFRQHFAVKIRWLWKPPNAPVETNVWTPVHRIPWLRRLPSTPKVCNAGDRQKHQGRNKIFSWT